MRLPAQRAGDWPGCGRVVALFVVIEAGVPHERQPCQERSAPGVQRTDPTPGRTGRGCLNGRTCVGRVASRRRSPQEAAADRC
jgi:hypothetical protein